MLCHGGYNFDTGQWIGQPLDLNLDDPRNDGQPVNWLYLMDSRSIGPLFLDHRCDPETAEEAPEGTHGV